MDLDIAGRKALLCASNAGLGLACAKAVAAEGVDVENLLAARRNNRSNIFD